ncbi:MAG: hypothetical protein JSV74_00735 [Dehalococcoidia bacterium]|nr:MAG: hypothetical protein JSV74_00735 [Dehalococcoidia bacterium]
MAVNWSQAYSELIDYVQNNPEIKISSRVVRIPSAIRDDFYSLHKKVRTIFLKEKTPELLEKSELLSSHYLKTREEVMRIVGLKEISIYGSVESFLLDPVEQLIKELFNPLMLLLKGELDIAGYEATAMDNAEKAFKHLYRSGYQKWLVLSFLKLLKADKVFKVFPEEVTEDDTLRHGVQIEHKIPDPEEVDNIYFRREPEVGFMVPDLLIHSALFDRYYSFTSEIIKALAAATNHSKKREWLPGDPNIVFEGDIILVYVDTSLNDLSLVTDMNTTCKADLILECKVYEKWHEKEGLSSILKHYAKYKPRMGTFIITFDPITDSLKKEIMTANLTDEDKVDIDYPKISFIQAGFDQTRLKPVINAL